MEIIHAVPMLNDATKKKKIENTMLKLVSFSPKSIRKWLYTRMQFVYSNTNALYAI